MKTMSHLDRLEAEAIYILREVAATCEKPVMLYSVGKDSSCMLHLAMKAFYPEKPPFPFLHIDTGWKFREMIEFRNRRMKELGLELIVYQNREAIEQGVTPFTHGSTYTDLLKTQALRDALDQYGFTAAFGGGRRDEEKSRAKERIFSFRNRSHAWEPRNQRPEMWHQFNTSIREGESIRVFPLSNWTESDIWEYIRREKIEIVDLYYARKRPCVDYHGSIIMVDDDRIIEALALKAEDIKERLVRFRALGCYPLTGAVESEADTLDKIVRETLSAVNSERITRVIDKDSGSASMEKRKREGYF